VPLLCPSLIRSNCQVLLPSCLQALTRVKDLDIHSNCISSLAPLSTLTGLVTLNAAANRLQDLPCLTDLTQLTQLNLRHNLITQLTPAATAPAAACAAAAAAAGSLDTGWPCSSQSSGSLLPCSMQRLSLACNQLQDVSTLTGERAQAMGGSGVDFWPGVAPSWAPC
jgi:Leucine-rich repeat (LRR) protein